MEQVTQAHDPQGGAIYIKFRALAGWESETIQKWSRHPFDGAIRFDEATRTNDQAKDEEIARLREALEPFATLDHMIDNEGWIGNSGREPIHYWIGPSQIRRAREVYGDEPHG